MRAHLQNQRRLRLRFRAVTTFQRARDRACRSKRRRARCRPTDDTKCTFVNRNRDIVGCVQNARAAVERLRREFTGTIEVREKTLKYTKNRKEHFPGDNLKSPTSFLSLQTPGSDRPKRFCLVQLDCYSGENHHRTPDRRLSVCADTLQARSKYGKKR